MGTAALLMIAVVAVAVLLVLVIKVEVPAFVALLLVSMGTALATGIPLANVVPVMVAGMGKVLGSVAIVVGLGSMLGRLIEVSGGADNLARRFTEVLGPEARRRRADRRVLHSGHPGVLRRRHSSSWLRSSSASPRSPRSIR